MIHGTRNRIWFLDMVKRKSDARPRPVFRTGRMFQDGNGWYFYTREGTVEGPFGSEAEAKKQVDAYIHLIEAGLLKKVSDLSVAS